jgi:UDP-glucose 4-epimerase
VVDLARAHVRALEWMEDRPAPVCEVFNIGTGKGNSVLEVINAFKEATGAPLPYVTGPRRAGDTTSVYADTTKSTAVLGWVPKLSLHDALRDAWRWQQALVEDKS